MHFTKMQGLGNDYLYVYGDVPEDIAALSRRLSDRHFGAGADGMIYISPSDTVDFKMRIFNADGSEAKMCGNGIRCVGKFVYDKGYTDKTHLSVETLSGVKTLDLQIRSGKVKSVTVDMGKVTVGEEKEIVIDGRAVGGIPVSVGNPHFVIFVDQTPDDIETLGRKIETSSYFPEQVNVEFVEVINHQHIKMRVWERGSGETFACGTGACASMYASYLTKRTGDHVKVTLLGGDLNIHLNEDHHIMMEGPATTVFEGEI